MSGPVNYDRVMVATTTTGTGTLTLGAPVTGFQAVPAAADGKLLRSSVFSVDGSGVPTGEWETFVGLYTHSGTTLTRGTFKASSTGAAVSFAAGTKRVAVSQLASAVPSIIAGANADTTMVPGGRYIVDMSAWATADRLYTLPTTAAIGDEIEVYVLDEDATGTLYELILRTGAGQTCAFAGGAAIAAATEITRLFITGERIKFLYAATNKWLVIYDGRIPQVGHMRLSTQADGEVAATFAYPTNMGGAWTADINRGRICDVTTGKITTRRACNAVLAVAMRTKDANTADNYVSVVLENTTALFYLVQQSVWPAVGANTQASNSATVGLAVDDFVRYAYRTQIGGIGLTADGTNPFGSPSFFSFAEIL